MDTSAQSKEIAIRLKELRTQAGFSHARLVEEIKSRFNISIDKTTLMNYEVIDEDHGKFGKNLGMNIKFISCFAEIYGVSVDYILGFSSLSTINPNIKTVCEYTGLSEKAVESLTDNSIYNSLLNCILCSVGFSDFLFELSNCKLVSDELVSKKSCEIFTQSINDENFDEKSSALDKLNERTLLLKASYLSFIEASAALANDITNCKKVLKDASRFIAKMDAEMEAFLYPEEN